MVLSSAEVDALVPGAELSYGDRADARWQMGRVAVSEVNHRSTHNRITPIGGDEPPIVLVPNTAEYVIDLDLSVKPQAAWFAEDGRHRTIAAAQSGVDTLPAFFLVTYAVAS